MTPKTWTSHFARIALASAMSALLTMTVAPALAHVPSVESGDHQESVTDIGGPEKSRAIYGYLRGGEADAYVFTAEEALVRTVGLIVPAHPEHADFRPTLVLVADGTEVGRAEDPGLVEREREFEPFSLTWFWTGAEGEFAFERDVEYVLRVEPGESADPDGRYVVVIGGPEEFTGSDIGVTFTSLPRIWLGQYGDAPLRWNWLVLIPGAFLLAALAFVVFLAWTAVRSRRPAR